jgi:hypothetical protein
MADFQVEACFWSVVWPFAFTADCLPTRLVTFEEDIIADASLSTLGRFLVLTSPPSTTFRKWVAFVRTLLETLAFFVRLIGRYIQISQSLQRHVAVRHHLEPHLWLAVVQKTRTSCLLYGQSSALDISDANCQIKANSSAELALTFHQIPGTREFDCFVSDGKKRPSEGLEQETYLETLSPPQPRPHLQARSH